MLMWYQRLEDSFEYLKMTHAAEILQDLGTRTLRMHRMTYTLHHQMLDMIADKVIIQNLRFTCR
jgi:hypothetical protein